MVIKNKMESSNIDHIDLRIELVSFLTKKCRINSELKKSILDVLDIDINEDDLNELRVIKFNKKKSN